MAQLRDTCSSSWQELFDLSNHWIASTFFPPFNAIRPSSTHRL